MTISPVTASGRIGPHTDDDKLRQVLAVLCNTEYTASAGGLAAIEISRLLLSNRGIRLHWRTIDTLLVGRRDLVDRRKNQGRWRYTVLKAGRDFVGVPESPIMLIDPAKALQAVVMLHDSLASLSGQVSICDPYLDDVSLEHIDSCPHGSAVRLLTQTVRDNGKLRRLFAATRISGPDLAVRVLPGTTLHDRYIIDDKSMLILGTSLNGFGKKQCFIIRAGDDVRRAMLTTFDTNWSTATPWL